MPPRVTILISAYNQGRLLAAAIDSALAQTFADFEVLVVDDASTDGSRAVVERYRDPRLRLLLNETNLGVGAALNRGLAVIESEYVARLDGDDLALPERLAQQVRYLDDHPDVAAVGAQAVIIDVRGQVTGRQWRPTSARGIRWCGIFSSPLIHSAATYRRAVVWDELGGYDARFRYGEDFDLFDRMSRRYALANLPQALAAYREDPRSITHTARHPGREGYSERKEPRIHQNLREALETDDVPRAWIAEWLKLGDVTIAQSDDAVRDVVASIERCAARFAAIHGDDQDVARFQAEMFIRALRKAGRLHALRLWLKAWRRHRPAALRELPRFALTFLFGQAPLRWRRAMRARRRRTVRESRT